MTQQEASTIQDRLNANDERMTRIEDGLADNTATISRIEDDLSVNTTATQETALKGAFKTLEWVGVLAKPLGYIVSLGAAVVGVWAAFKHGGPR